MTLVRKIKRLHIYKPSGPSRQAGAYSSFFSMKQLGVFLLPPGWVAPPLGGERYCQRSVLPKNTTHCPQPGLEPGPLDPETNVLQAYEATATP